MNLGMLYEFIGKERVKKIDPNTDLPAIPDDLVTGWKQKEIRECGEELVPIGTFTEFSDCDVWGNYFGERGTGKEQNFVGHPIDRRASLITHFVREGVLNRLKIAQASLPYVCYFRFYDNYRSLEVQQALFDAVLEIVREDKSSLKDDELMEETQKYCSLPSPNKELGTSHPSPHNTGGVVDLTIVRLTDEGIVQLGLLNLKKVDGRLAKKDGQIENEAYEVVINEIASWRRKFGFSEKIMKEIENNWLVNYRYYKQKAQIFHLYSQELDMGTTFDYFGPETMTNYYEKIEDEKLTRNERIIRNNRRFFYQVMKNAGFSNYPEEWWHWSYGDQMWATCLGKEFAIYGGVKMSEVNRQFEQMRREVYFDACNRKKQKMLFADLTEEDPQKIYK